AAAQSAASLCPNGTLATIRISTIKPTGSRAGFEQAAKDHMKWYRDHGFKDNEQIIADVITMDEASHGPVVSKTEVMTIHYNPAGAAVAMRDAAWDAYVAEYRANSDIASEHTACLPKQPKKK